MKNIGIGKVYTSKPTDTKNIGFGLYDVSKVGFIEDPNGKVYVDDVLCNIISEIGIDPTMVKIGKNYYHTVTIGNLQWIVENLREDLGTEGVDWCKHPVDDKTYGHFYKFDAYSHIDELHSDWRIPRDADIMDLVEAVSGQSIDYNTTSANIGYAVNANDDHWNPNNNTNTSGLSLVPSGYKNSIEATDAFSVGTENRYGFYGNNGNFCGTFYTKSTNNVFTFTKPSNIVGNTVARCIRLCRDISPKIMTVGDRSYNYVRVNSRYWTTVNLDIPVGDGERNPNAPEEFGLYYSKNSIGLINALCPAGWRVPTLDDMADLIMTRTATETGNQKLLGYFDAKYADYWKGKGFATNNVTGLSLMPTRLVTSTSAQFDRANYLMNNNSYTECILQVAANGTPTTQLVNWGTTKASIRLCKEV